MLLSNYCLPSVTLLVLDEEEEVVERSDGYDCLCHVNVLPCVCVDYWTAAPDTERPKNYIIYGQITNYSYYFNCHPTHTNTLGGHSSSQSIPMAAKYVLRSRSEWWPRDHHYHQFMVGFVCSSRGWEWEVYPIQNLHSMLQFL